MKKIILLISFSFVMFLLGCDGFVVNTSMIDSSIESSTNDNETIENTYEKSTEIPTIEDDTELTTSFPITSKEELTSTEEETSTEEPTSTDEETFTEVQTTIEITEDQTETPTSHQETINEDEAYIQEVYLMISEYFPEQISEDTVLPMLLKEGLSIRYYLNNQRLENYKIIYEALSYSKTLDIRVIIDYQSSSQIFDFTILQLRDEDMYQESLVNEIFLDAIEEIQAAIPTYVQSDISLPKHDVVQVSYSVDHSYILNNRLIFIFHDQDKTVNMNIELTYQNQIRTHQLILTFLAMTKIHKIPEIHITTEANQSIDSKETYVYGHLTLYNFNEYNQEEILLNQVGMNIRLRGNSTLYMPKLPYKIKFDDKQSMFTDYFEKDWVLLANFSDQTLIRNALAFQLSRDLNMEFSPSFQFVDLYVNGVYQGNYLLTDQVEVTNDRINIEENTSNIDTGYLLEYDMRIYDEGLDTTKENYFLIDGIPFVIKSPDYYDQHYLPGQKEYIETYMNDLFNVLKNKEDYHHLIDESTFIDWFIVNEIFKNVDSGYSSVYYYKDQGGLLKMGPVWDFDLSSGNYGHLQEDLRGPEGFYTSRSEKNRIFYYLMEYDEFKSALKLRWNQVYEEVILNIIDEVYRLTDQINLSRYHNFQSWDIIGSYQDWFVSPELLAIQTYEGQVEFLRDFLIIRIDWLNQEINKFN
ncbi:hypothetical protein HF295_07855 [Hujiaoplasma nucleasis]|uniref:Spore coat protein CotH n=1 Tax=Hujiaoplasma nucleasis TaxID=2725268 RepID=A0A7L6N3C7_9MOLU|nr:CotH kinase family protein [Hujiaoplasma nucleasis]QLY40770.1 hypothetical protein HF295_07855 [Hujiaoplasma nucleasis]